MKRMLYLLLLSIVLVGCPTPSSEPTPTPHTTATPVTPSEPEPLVPPTPVIVDYRAEWATSHTDNTHTFSVTVKAIYDDNSVRVLAPAEYDLSNWYYEHPQTDTDYEVTDTATVTVGTWSDSHSETMTVISVYTEYVSKELVVNYDVPKQVGDIYYNFEYTVKITNNKNDEVRTTTYTTIEELDASGIKHDLVAHEWYLPSTTKYQGSVYTKMFTIDGITKSIDISMPGVYYKGVDENGKVNLIVQMQRYTDRFDFKIKLICDVLAGGNTIYSGLVLDKLPEGMSLIGCYDWHGECYGLFSVPRSETTDYFIINDNFFTGKSLVMNFELKWTVASTFSLKSTDFVILASDTSNPNWVYTWDGKHGRIHSQGITGE